MRSIVIAVLSRLIKLLQRDSSVRFGYIGRFDSWAQAKGDSLGYQDPKIAAQVALGAGTVLAGKAVYERDSVTFSSREYSFPVATALLWAASRWRGTLKVLDFGGGLGTSFFQNKPFMAWMSRIEWAIVEQQTFVEQGQRLFKHDQLCFHSSVEEGLQGVTPQLALLSSSLQYVENPYNVLTAIVSARVEMVVIDRTLFYGDLSDCVTRQHVPAEIFPATIPTWIFSEQRLVEFMEADYRLVSRFPSYRTTAEWDSEKRNLEELGFIFVLKGSDYDRALSSSSL
jgi:putative methyltransferase (TIGR04325 family)